MRLEKGDINVLGATKAAFDAVVRITDDVLPAAAKPPLGWCSYVRTDGANICSIVLRDRYARVPVSIATSGQHRLWSRLTGRRTFTPWARPSGSPPIAADVAAGRSLPQTV